MQWLLLLLWGVWLLRATGDARRARRFAATLGAVIWLSMGVQLLLLGRAGQLTPGTALPLHLCGAMGVLSAPMLWTRNRTLYALSLLLGAPCALCALLFPAIIHNPFPRLMRLAFFQLHVGIVLAPLFLWRTGMPPPADPRAALLWLDAFLVLVSAVNRVAGTNYLFLRAPPPTTPLYWLAGRGYAAYLLSLQLLVMLLMTALAALYRRASERASVNG